MTEKERFTIVPSNLIEDGFFINDNKGSFSFPTTKDKSCLIMYEKHLNELSDKNEHIKQVIKEAYNHERTHIGKNVLKQLLEAIQ